MMRAKTAWLLLGILSLASFAVAQDTAWEKYMKAAKAAFDQGQYAEAEKQLAAALKQAEKFGEQDPRLASSLNALGMVYDRQGRYAEVEPLYRRSLAIAEKVLGPEHPNVARSCAHIRPLFDLILFHPHTDVRISPLQRIAHSERPEAVEVSEMIVIENIENNVGSRVIPLDLLHSQVGLIDAIASHAVVLDWLTEVSSESFLPSLAVVDLITVGITVPVGANSRLFVWKVHSCPRACSLIGVVSPRTVQAVVTVGIHQPTAKVGIVHPAEIGMVAGNHRLLVQEARHPIASAHKRPKVGDSFVFLVLSAQFQAGRGA